MIILIAEKLVLIHSPRKDYGIMKPAAYKQPKACYAKKPRD